MTARTLPSDAYRSFFENSMDAVLLTVPEGRIVAANPAACAMFGMTEAELCARGRDSLIDPADPGFSSFLEGRERFGKIQGELIFKRKDGSMLIGEASSVILDHGEKAFFIIRDITAHKKADETLRTTLESIGDGFFAVDADWRFIYVNAMAERLLGINREEVLGRTCWEVFPDTRGTRIENEYRRAASGEIRDWENFYESWGRWFHNRCFPREGGGISVYFQDITARKRSEEDLQRAHALIEGITTGTEDLIAALDPDFRYLFCNDAYRREFKTLWGRDIEIGTSMLEALACWPNEQRKAKELWRRALEGEFFSTTVEFGPSEQEQQVYDLRSNPVYDGQGRQIGAAHIQRNVTERARMQQALRESEAQARRIIDNSVALMGIMNPDGTLIEANAVALHAGGLRREEVVGKKFWDCFWWSYDVKVQAWLQEAVAKAAGGEVVRYDVVVRTAQDGRMPIDFMLAPVRNSAGQVTHLIPSALDMTEHKIAEEALRKTSERLELAVQVTRLGMFDFAPQSGKLTWSETAKRHFGLSADAHVDYDVFLKGLHPEDRDRVHQIVQDVLRPASGGIYLTEYRTIGLEDGEKRYLEARGQVFFDEQGRPLRFIGATLDITERKQAEEEIKEAKAAAEEASRAKSEFLANMSHEIRTPMTVFMAAIEHLLEIDRHPQHQQLLEMADQSAKRLLSLIEELLDFSRMEARKLTIEKKIFDLRTCVHEAVYFFALPAQEKNLQLELEIASDIPERVIGDPDRLGQVLINLVGNAVKFTHEGGIRVCVKPRGNSMEFTVSDTGIGIPEEKYDLIFQSFTQVDSSFTRRFGGTGLGLAISKGLVALMGGEISVRSEEKGSVFTFIIPLKTAVRQTGRSFEPPAKATGKETFAARILLAEDDPSIRKMIEMMLAQRGWHVETAGSGREAVEKWERGDFDLILMDLQMPEMNGLEATRMIREREAGGEKHTAIIALTAHARREIKEECLMAGMDEVLTKPFQVNDLYSTACNCLKNFL